MRIDKFLKVSRILKRRALAVEAADKNRVLVNGRVVKPSCKVKEGDVVEVLFNSGAIKFKILSIKETVKKEQAHELYQIIAE